MNRFWDEIICPLFIELNPRVVIEIGADRGLNTKNILDYCSANDSKLVSIDPSPNFDINKFKKEYGDSFEFIGELSLQCLPSLRDYDIILIDGDHNWYTVYNELKSIEKNFNQESFPFVMLHDISWPYGRRDLYYNPENIPKEYLHEFNQLGMAPDINGLLEVAGINSNLNNAIFENGPKNGVLTAIEDFLDETDLDLTFYKLNCFNGLGLIYPKNNHFDNLIDKIVYKSNILDIIEKKYNNVTVALSQNKNQVSVLNSSLVTKQDEINKILSERDSLVERNVVLSDEIKCLVSERDSLVERNGELSSKVDSWQKYNNSLLDKINFLNGSNGELVSERDSLVERNVVLSDEIKCLVSERDSLVERISTLNQKKYALSEYNSRLSSEIDLLNKRFVAMKNSKNDLINDMLKLINENSNLKNMNQSLLESNSWKLTGPLRKVLVYFKNK